MQVRRFLIILMIVLVVMGLMVPAVLADPGGNPNGNACFGHFRAEGAHSTKAVPGFNLGMFIKYVAGTPQADGIHYIQGGGVLDDFGFAPCG